jgi:hypothetical protein
VNAARSDPPTPRARAAARAAQRREQEREARRKERMNRRREHREQESEEYRLHEQQGLSPPATLENSSSEEVEEGESDGGWAPAERWDPPPPSPRVIEVAKKQAPAAGVEALAAGRSVEEAARVAKAPASATTVATGAVEAPPEPSRKRKRGFSSLRYGAFSPGAHDFEGLELSFMFLRSQGGTDRPRPRAC